MGFIISPFLSPFAFGFLVARTTWRWAYGIGCLYGLVVLILIVFFMEETYDLLNFFNKPTLLIYYCEPQHVRPNSEAYPSTSLDRTPLQNREPSWNNGIQNG